MIALLLTCLFQGTPFPPDPEMPAYTLPDPLVPDSFAHIHFDGQVYTIVGAYTENKNAKLIDLFAMPVEATGEVAEKDGAKELKITALKKVS